MMARLLLLSLFLLSSPALLRADPVKGQVKSISGNAVLVTAGGKSEPITSTTVIPPGSKILTTANAKLVIEWLPGAFSILYPNSNVAISSLNYSKPADGAAHRQVALRLVKGSIFSHLVHNDGTSDFRIKTSQGVAAARGTDWFVSFVGGIVKVSVLADTVTITLPSGKVVTVPALFGYTMGDPDSSRLSEDEFQRLLQDLKDAGLTITVQDINDPNHPTAPGAGNSGYLVTFTPVTGDGFQFFVPRWIGRPDEPGMHRPLGESPIPSSEFPPVTPASP